MHSRSAQRFEKARRYAPLAGVVGLFALTVAFVNPLYEMPLYDDWAYSWTVDRLLQTGRYIEHPWYIANNVAQIYWGALFESLFGRSFVTLRASTLVLIAALLVAFYLLARELAFSRAASALLALMLFASPIGLTFSFSFMTDLPFLSILVIALWLYMRALRSGSAGWMLAAGIAGGLATLTRQVGVGVVPALAILWLVNGRSWKKLPFYLLGIIPPVLGLAWQVYYGVAQPSWATAGERGVELAYLMQVGPLIPETLWRLMAAMQTISLAFLPLSILAIVDYAHVLGQTRGRRITQEPVRTEALILAGLGGFILVMLLIGAFALGKPGLIPFLLSTFWYLSVVPPLGLALLTGVTSLGAFCIGRLIILRYANGAWRRLPAYEWVLDLTTASILVVNILWLFYLDRYLIPLQPFILIVVGRAVAPMLAEHIRIPAAATVVALVFFANIIRADTASLAARVRAGEALLGQGVPADQIASGDWAWDSLHGAFDRFKAREGNATGAMWSDFFITFFDDQQAAARYVITPLQNEPDPHQWQVVNRVQYIGYAGQVDSIVTLKRLDASSQ